MSLIIAEPPAYLAEAGLELFDGRLPQPDPRERVQRRAPDVARCLGFRVEDLGLGLYNPRVRGLGFMGSGLGFSEAGRGSGLGGDAAARNLDPPMRHAARRAGDGLGGEVSV